MKISSNLIEYSFGQHSGSDASAASKIFGHYMQTPEGRQKLLASAYQPAWLMFEYTTLDNPEEKPTHESVRSYVFLLQATPLAERTEAWTKLYHVVEALLQKM